MRFWAYPSTLLNINCVEIVCGLMPSGLMPAGSVEISKSDADSVKSVDPRYRKMVSGKPVVITDPNEVQSIDNAIKLENVIIEQQGNLDNQKFYSALESEPLTHSGSRFSPSWKYVMEMLEPTMGNPDFTPGKYIIFGGYTWNMESNTASMVVQLLFDGQVLRENRVEPKSSIGDYMDTGSSQKITSSFSPKVIEIPTELESIVKLKKVDVRFQILNRSGSSTRGSIWGVSVWIQKFYGSDEV